MTGTVSWIEVFWTAAAVPGLLLWAWNLHGAVRSLRAIRSLRVGNGRLMWAQFSTLMTSVFVGIESVFLLLGFISMAREENPTATVWTQAVLGGGLVLASVAISFLAWRWRVVDHAIIVAAKIREERSHWRTDPGTRRAR